MRLLLIRHGETEHNVAGLLAGVTDSRLTNHGVTQTRRLAQHLIEKRNIQFSHVYSSDLQRAIQTAEAICDAQNSKTETKSFAPIPLALLREQDFGSFELLPWNRSPTSRSKDPKEGDPDFRPKETSEAMTVRAETFVDDNIVPVLVLDAEEDMCVAIVSHGLFLAALWRTLLARFRTSSVTLAPDLYPHCASRPLEYLPSWTNTGILELVLSTKQLKEHEKEMARDDISDVFGNLAMRVVAVNCKDHLTNLKRTRGGVGSSAADGKQKSLDKFFKKPKIND